MFLLMFLSFSLSGVDDVVDDDDDDDDDCLALVSSTQGAGRVKSAFTTRITSRD